MTPAKGITTIIVAAATSRPTDGDHELQPQDVRHQPEPDRGPWPYGGVVGRMVGQACSVHRTLTIRRVGSLTACQIALAY
ncbi:MAG: hypothetical protein AMS20_08050 [Gemmatimonas sp. SG8_28]|nr:MAG: hypothetical protein AMS20_08050 [Gemmatimonas sp. SG8_28]